MNAEAELERLVDAHHTTLTEAAQLIREEESWSLNSPCVLITRERSQVIPVSSIGSHITVCAHVDHPLITEWLELAKQTSPERALETMLNQSDEEQAEDFAVVYDEWRKDRKERGAGDLSAGDLARFQVKARGAHPSEVPVLAQITGENGRQGVMTFCVSVASLLRS